MSSLLRSIHDIWESTPALTDMVPHARVFSGRVPQTEMYRFPYVSILATQGGHNSRTDKSRYSHGPVSFHIWVDDSRLEFAETLAELITQTYTDRCWPLSDSAAVIDVLDEGEPTAHQTDLPSVKAWEVVKLFTVFIERLRVDHDDDCCTSQFTTSEADSVTSASESSENT